MKWVLSVADTLRYKAGLSRGACVRVCARVRTPCVSTEQGLRMQAPEAPDCCHVLGKLLRSCVISGEYPELGIQGQAFRLRVLALNHVRRRMSPPPPPLIPFGVKHSY